MDTNITETPHHHAPSPGELFSPGELAAMKAQDMAAGRAVVLLMCGIFLLGVFIYTVVACAVAF